MSPPDRSAEIDTGHTARLVLLGASNLTRALSCILGTARLRIGIETGEPLDAMVACGLGRSYAITNSMLCRTLPGVQACRLWQDLNDRTDAQTYALITDIGNDILYDVPLHEIVGAVEFCLRKLCDLTARIVITGLPMASVRRLTPQRYLVVRRMLFPSCRIPYEQAMDRAEQLDLAVRSIAGAAGATVMDFEPCWYGIDPIHIKWRHWPDAWRKILAPWNPSHSPARAAPSPMRWLRVKTSWPREWTLLGCDLAHVQPVGRTRDGIFVSMY